MLQKSTWNAFLARATSEAFEYIGSQWGTTPEALLSAIEANPLSPFSANRAFEGGKTALRFKNLVTGSTAHIDREGTVFAHGDLFIIFRKNDSPENANCVCYRFAPK